MQVGCRWEGRQVIRTARQQDPRGAVEEEVVGCLVRRDGAEHWGVPVRDWETIFSAFLGGWRLIDHPDDQSQRTSRLSRHSYTATQKWEEVEVVASAEPAER